MKKICLLLSALLLTSDLVAEPLEFYLPEGELFDASIPAPDTILGQQLGERHLRHDQLVSYLSILAASRPNAKLIEYGRSNEGRRLVMLAISSAQNIQNIEQVKSDPNVLKILNGFGVHGNESSSSNASVLWAWYLLATNNPSIRDALDSTVVLIDPSLNPDGYARFATYVNNQRSLSTVTDSNDISHVEPWPSGRTNHYWFDLNRDWLLLTQTESKARIKQFHDWQPHILTDHHEMGSAATFFFQPGVPSRKNPLILDKNVELTHKLAQFHAKVLDQVGQRYYKEESFDDFYPGKGSTYPDLQGSIGVLFEQASAVGGKIDTRNGQTTLTDGIRNQFLTARSTFEGAQANRDDFINYKKNFFTQARQKASKLPHQGYLLDLSHNAYVAKRLQQFLSQHQIIHQTLNSDKTIQGHRFKQKTAIYIPLNQDQTTLVQSLFNTETSFTDNTFYDVSAWNLPMAWGLPWKKVTANIDVSNEPLNIKPKNGYVKNAKAYVFDWSTGNAPAALNYLSQQNQDVFISGKPLNIDGISVTAGSFILPVDEKITEDTLFSILSTITDAFDVQWYPLSTSLADSGVDLGSPNIQKLKPAKVMMLVGTGINAYQAGSLWHLFDTQVYLPLTKVRLSYFKQINLNDYTHIIMPSGNYQSKFDEATTDKLNNWVKAGGHLIAIQQAAQWVENNLQAKNKSTEDSSQESIELERKAYGDYATDYAKKVMGGAIIAADADLSHPLAFGTHLKTQHVLVKGKAVLSHGESERKTAYNIPLQATKTVKAAGYVSDYWLEKLTAAPLVAAQKSGQGSLIKFGFNPNFRAFWYGTQRWMINSIFLADLIKKTQ